MARLWHDTFERFRKRINALMNTLHISTAGPELASALAVLGSSQPSAEFNITISGGNLAALLAGAAIAGAPAVVNTYSPPSVPEITKKFVGEVPETITVSAQGAGGGSSDAKRIRRTKEENAAGLTIEEAEAFRAQTVYGDPQSFKASLGGDAPDAPVSAPAETPAPAEAPAPAPAEAPAHKPSAEITEADLRAAGANAVAAGKIAEVKAVAAEFGVKKWSELSPAQYGAALAKLTALMVIS